MKDSTLTKKEMLIKSVTGVSKCGPESMGEESHGHTLFLLNIFQIHEKGHFDKVLSY